MHSHTCEALNAIARYAESTPQSPALIEPGGLTLSYRELWTQIAALDLRLQEAGIGSQEVVAVLLPQGALQVLTVSGVLSHSVCAPLQSRTTVSEVEAALRKLNVSALIVSPEFEAEIMTASAMGLTVLVARKDQSPREWQIRRPASLQKTRAASLDAILLLITSATTGTSKLAQSTSVNLNARIASKRDVLQLTASDRLLLMASLSHNIGIESTFAEFLVGGTVIATGGFDPTGYPLWLRELRPTWYNCAPAVHQAALVQLKRELPAEVLALRFVQSAGAPLPSEVKLELERILRVPMFNDYGSTETGPIATDAFLSGGRVANSVGRSCGLEIGIVTPPGDFLPSGKEGEIVVRGPAVISGYADNAEANQSAFRNGWFRTGDAGRMDADGNLFVTGRLKEMINRGGEKILPAEVDVALATHPAVLEAAAFAVPHPTLGEDVACAVVLRGAPNEAHVSERELRRHVAQLLASFKVPRRIYFVDQIPRGELGKPQRWLLTENLSARHVSPALPAELTERRLFFKLHEIWMRILECDDLGFDEDFFEAGGDSLAAINMLVEVDEHFGSLTSASAASFLDEPTLAHLTDLVRTTLNVKPSQSASSEIRVFPIREGSFSQQLFCIPADTDEGLYFRRLATRLYDDEMELSIVRPANTLHGPELFTIEHAGAATAALIRQVQAEGPYFVAGYCYGGIVAVEAARQLILEGQDVRLILFDVPMPGYPSLFFDWPALIEGVRHKWRMEGNGDCPEMATNSRSFARRLAWLSGILHLFARRLVWSAVVPVRSLLAPIENITAVQRLHCGRKPGHH